MKADLTKTFRDKQLSEFLNLGVPFVSAGKAVFYAGGKSLWM